MTVIILQIIAFYRQSYEATITQRTGLKVAGDVGIGEELGHRGLGLPAPHGRTVACAWCWSGRNGRTCRCGLLLSLQLGSGRHNPVRDGRMRHHVS